MALGSGLPGAKLETLPQRMPGSHMRPGRVTPALGEGVVLLRLLASQTAGPLGPLGRPRCCLLLAHCFPKWEGETG